MFQIPTANALVEFVKDFTGSTNDAEIKKCIFMAELSMRNIELPALRCDPYDPQNIGVADSQGRIPIPGDMNKPILFFKQGVQYQTTAYCTGNIGETTITITTQPNQSLTVGMTVTGTGIASGATIVSFPTSSTITLSSANTANVDGWLIFVTPGAANPSSQTGPWIVYDRIGDRDIITQGMIAQLYLQPVNVPAVIRGKFSEVGAYYEFLPYVAGGDLINMYYYKAWPLLFSPADNQIISTDGTVSVVTGSGPWTGTITGMGDTSQLTVGDTIIATNGANVVLGTSGLVSGISGSGPWTATLSNLTTTTGFIAGQTLTATNGTGEIVSATGTVQNITGSGPWTAEITDLTDTSVLAVGQEISATDGIGTFVSSGAYINGYYNSGGDWYVDIQGMDFGSTSLFNNGDIFLYTPDVGTLGTSTTITVQNISGATSMNIIVTGGTGPNGTGPGYNLTNILNGSVIPTIGTGGAYVITNIINSTTIEYSATGGTTPVVGQVIDVTGNGGSLGGSGVYKVLSVDSPSAITFIATGGTTPVEGSVTNPTVLGGSLGTGGTYTVASIPSSTSITFTATDGTTPLIGDVTDITLINITVQSNAVLSTWPEGYVYATLREYYIKRHNDQDAAVYSAKFDEAWKTVEDQNNLGKWSGGHTRLTSVWQPRQYRQYNIK